MGREEPRCAVEEIRACALRPAHLRAGDRMAADESFVRDGAGEHAFGRPDVGDRRVAGRVQRGLDGGRQHRHLHRDDHELRGAGRIVGRSGGIDGAQGGGGGEGCAVRVPPAHVVTGAARGEPDRGAHQSGADYRHFHSASFAVTLCPMSPAPRSELWSWRSERGGSVR